MTDTVLISLVGAAATVSLAIVNGVFAMMANARGKRNETQLKENSGHLVDTKADVAAIKLQTDGMTQRIETLAGEKGVLEGHAQGMLDAGTVPVMMAPQPEPELKRRI